MDKDSGTHNPHVFCWWHCSHHTHTEHDLQQLISPFNHDCKVFRLTINMKNKMSSVRMFLYFHQPMKLSQVTLHIWGSTIINNLLLNLETEKHISKTAAVMAKLSKRIWDNCQLTLCTKLTEFQACVICTLFYGSKIWRTYTRKTTWKASISIVPHVSSA